MKKTLLSILAVLVLAFSSLAWADYTISNGGITPQLNQNVVGQSFTTESAGVITSIKMDASIGSSLSLTLNIYAGQSVASPPLYTQSVTRSGSGWTTHTFTLTTPLTVTANTQYTFALTGSANFTAYKTLLSTYSGGQAYHSGAFKSGSDINFEVNVAALPNYTISGFVTHASIPVSGVTLTFSHDGGTTTTNILGYYSYTVVSGTTTTITASKSGYAGWDPAARTLTNITSNQTGQNFAGSLATHTISGTVTDGINPIAGVTLTFSHNLETTTTDANGAYSYTFYDGVTTTITPSHPAYENWSPVTRLVTSISSDQADQNFTGTLKTFVVTGIVSRCLMPLSGATVTFSHNGATVTTCPLGIYSYSVPYGTTTTITPSLAGYGNWSPASRTLTNITENYMLQNFMGTPSSVVISGTVTDGVNPLAGVTLTFSHDGATVTTDANGSYSYTVPGATTTTVTPSHPGYHGWSPASITLTNISEDQPGQNFAGTINTYTISGTATDGANPVAGVTITFSHNSLTTTTDSSGTYSYTVNYGTTTTVTPSHAGYGTFNPVSRTVSSIAANTPAQDFIGLVNSYSISGTVTDGTNPLVGVTITFSHDSATVTTDAGGNYSYPVDYGTTTTVTPSHPGYHGWSPASITLTSISANQPSQDFAGVINMYTISGTVAAGTAPVGAVTITFSHDGHTESTDASGRYAYTVPYNTTTTVTPSHPGYSIWAPVDISLANIAADQPDQDFNTQPSSFVVAIEFKDEAGLPVGDVMCRLKVPGLQEWQVQSKGNIQLLWGKFPYNALFRNSDMALGGNYVFRFAAPGGWTFVSPDSMTLEVPAANNFYSTEGHLFILKKTGAAPADTGGVVQPPPVDAHPLVFVTGSPAWDNESWPNLVDEDLEGWDGTGTVKADENGDTWAIFRFRGNQISKFNYFYIQTDNGSDDDLFPDRQPYKVEVLFSTIGTQLGDFSSLGTYTIKSPQQTMYKIGREVTAKYVMLKIFTVAGAKNEWQQVVEFGLSWNKGSGAKLAADEMAVTALPTAFTLEPNFPNPFNPETTIRYQLVEDGNVRLSIFNLSGQEVSRLADGEESAGVHSLQWNAAHLPSGIYLVRLTTGQNTAMQRISLVK